MARSKYINWTILGPLFVVIAAAFWGIETLFRVNLNSRFDSEVLVFHEHLFCIAFTLPFMFGSLGKLRDVPRSCWIYLILSGSIGSAIGTTFFTLGLTKLSPSVANVLLNFQPVVTVIFASLLLKEKLGRGFVIWALLALVCGLIIASNDFNLAEFKWNIGLLYVLMTALLWGFSTVAGRGALKGLPLSVATGGRFIVGALTLLISLTLKGQMTAEHLKWAQLFDPFVLKNYLWLSFVAGVVPLYFYFKGLTKVSASVGGFCELTQTFSALVITWGFMHDPLNLKQVIAGIFLLFSVYMINVNFARANAVLEKTDKV